MVMPKKTPRYYQADAVAAAMAAIIENMAESKGSKIVIEAAAGAGKTLIIAMLADHVSSKGGEVLVISRQPVLAMQNYDECWEYEVTAAIYSAKFGKQTNSNVVVATEGTLANGIHSDFKKRRFDLIIIDESHQVPYDQDDSQFMKILNHFESNALKYGRKKPVQVVGLTGSPYRHIDSIIGKYWQKIVYDIGVEKLTEEGFLTPPVYGYPDEQGEGLDFSSLQPKYGDFAFGDNDFNSDELDEIVMSGDGKKRLVRIMAEVIEKTKERNQIIIFASTKRHAAEVKKVLIALGEDSDKIGLVTDDTPESERDEAVSRSKQGDLRWLINVSCLTTGFDSPLIDVVLFLRPIGSLTLLVQCLGRAARLLKDWMIDKGYQKANYLVLDYAGVFDRLGHLLDNPMVNEAELEKAKTEKRIIHCPKCHSENSDKARRCIGRDEDEPDKRCGHFFTEPLVCPKCETFNDKRAQACRSCGFELVDPNKKLLNKAYSDDEMVKVKEMRMEPSKNGALKVTYILDQDPERHGHPYELFFGMHKEAGKRIFQAQFVNAHIASWGWRSKVLAMKTAEQIVKMRDAFKAPTYIAYRINEKDKFVIGRRRFD